MLVYFYSLSFFHESQKLSIQGCYSPAYFKTCFPEHEL